MECKWDGNRFTHLCQLFLVEWFSRITLEPIHYLEMEGQLLTDSSTQGALALESSERLSWQNTGCSPSVSRRWGWGASGDGRRHGWICGRQARVGPPPLPHALPTGGVRAPSWLGLLLLRRGYKAEITQSNSRSNINLGFKSFIH